MTTPPTDEQLAEWEKGFRNYVGDSARGLALIQEVWRLRNVNSLMVSEHDDDLAGLRWKIEKAEAERDRYFSWHREAIARAELAERNRDLFRGALQKIAQSHPEWKGQRLQPLRRIEQEDVAIDALNQQEES